MLFLCARGAAWRLPGQSQELLEPDHFCPPLVATTRCLPAQGFEPLEPRPRPTDPAVLEAEGSRPLVVGYISPDLFVHSVSYFAEAPLTWHSPQAVNHIVYSCVMRPDVKTAKLKAATLAAGGQWQDVAGLSEHELATMVGVCLPAGSNMTVLSTFQRRHCCSSVMPAHFLQPGLLPSHCKSCAWRLALLG